MGHLPTWSLHPLLWIILHLSVIHHLDHLATCHLSITCIYNLSISFIYHLSISIICPLSLSLSPVSVYNLYLPPVIYHSHCPSSARPHHLSLTPHSPSVSHWAQPLNWRWTQAKKLQVPARIIHLCFLCIFFFSLFLPSSLPHFLASFLPFSHPILPPFLPSMSLTIFLLIACISKKSC